MSLVSLYDEASLWMTPSGVKDGKLFSELPVPEYGPEEVANGDFATDSDWTKESGWTISGGSANCLNGQGVSIYQTNVLDIGKYYKLTFTVSNYSQGFLGSIGNDFGGVVADTYGSYEIFGTATSTFFGFSAFGNFIGSIDNVSVKEVIKGDGDFTFSRGSNLAATRVGPTGLIEKGRENLLLRSNEFDNSYWTKSNATLTSGQSGHDGSTNAFKVDFIDGTASYVRRNETFSVKISTISFYLKAGTHNFIQILNSPSGQHFANFDISNGVTGNKGSSIIDSNITDVGNGWYRCSMTADFSAQVAYFVWPVNSITSSWANIATTSGNYYIQDAQMEIGLAATDYIESGATTGKAGLLEDEPRLDYSGGATCPSLLLEPSRTNLFTQSEYFNSSDWIKSNVTATNNSAISPDGLQNATLINDGTASGTQHWFYQSITLSSGTTYTISFYAKYVDRKNMFINIYDGATSNFVYYDIQNGVVLNADGNAVRDIVDVGSGWYRITYTRTIVGSGANFRIGMANDTPVQTYTGENKEALIYGLQVEVGSYPTSYIPNHSGGSVTRNFDYSIVESLGYSSTCTFYYEFNTTTGRESSSPFAEVGKDQSNKIWIKGASVNNPRFEVQGNGIFIGSISPTNEVSGINKIAVQWSSGVGVVFSNGVKQSGTLTNSNTSANIDFIATKGQGTSHDSKQLLFFEEALSDAECIKLTTL